MLKAVNTKILLAILAALTAIGSAAVYQRYETEKAATAATKARPGRRTSPSPCAERVPLWLPQSF